MSIQFFFSFFPKFFKAIKISFILGIVVGVCLVILLKVVDSCPFDVAETCQRWTLECMGGVDISSTVGIRYVSFQGVQSRL